MNNMDKTLPKLLNMLRTAEQIMKSKGKYILMVNENFKKHNERPNKPCNKWKGKEIVRPKPTSHAMKPSEGITKEAFSSTTVRLNIERETVQSTWKIKKWCKDFNFREFCHRN